MPSLPSIAAAALLGLGLYVCPKIVGWVSTCGLRMLAPDPCFIVWTPDPGSKDPSNPDVYNPKYRKSISSYIFTLGNRVVNCVSRL